MISCPRCHGTGCEPSTRRVIPFKMGTGFYVKCFNCKRCNGDGKMAPPVKCPTCNGDGCHPMANHPRTDKVRQEQPCPRCEGSGLWPEDKPASANDRQEGGNHYRKGGPNQEQHWDRLVRLYGLDVAFVYFVGNITAYVERYRDKNGIEDLKKARHYIDKLIELEEAHAATKNTTEIQSTDAFVKTYGRMGEEYSDIQKRLVEESLKRIDAEKSVKDAEKSLIATISQLDVAD